MKKILSSLLLGVMLLMVSFGTIEASASNNSKKVNQPTVNQVTTADSEVTGNAVKGAMVVAVVEGKVYKNTANKNGDFAVDIKKTYREGTDITMYQTVNGESSPRLHVYVQKANTQKPTAPTLDTLYDTDLTLTGTAQPNTTVKVLVGIDNYVVTTNNSGDFTIKLTTTYLENTKIEAIAQKDDATSDKTIAYVQTKNVSKPSTPKVIPVYSTDKVVTGSADADTTIKVTVGNDSYSSQSSSNGDFSVNMNKSYPASTVVEVVSIKNGQSSEVVSLRVLEADEVTLNKPTFNDITDKDTHVLGKADPNVTIHFTIGLDNYRANTDNQGNFVIELDNTYKFATEISAYAQDTLGNKSTVVVSSVIKGEVDLGVNYITTADTEITGATAPSSKLEVVIGNRVYEGTSNSSGAFTIQLAKTYTAGTVVEVSVTDSISGKVTTKKVIVYPRLPTINKIKAGDSMVSGTVDPDALVKVYISGKEYQGTANAAGNYSIPVNAGDVFKGNNISVMQISNSIESLSNYLMVE